MRVCEIRGTISLSVQSQFGSLGKWCARQEEEEDQPSHPCLLALSNHLDGVCSYFFTNPNRCRKLITRDIHRPARRQPIQDWAHVWGALAQHRSSQRHHRPVHHLRGSGTRDPRRIVLNVIHQYNGVYVRAVHRGVPLLLHRETGRLS